MAALSLTACEEDVIAITGIDQPFTLYSIFNPQADTQWVRVFPIEAILAPSSSMPLDARVTSTDLETGETRVWTDSLIVEPNGLFAHVFWSPFSVAYGHTYRIKAMRSDGAMSQAVTQVPEEATLALEEPILTPEAMHPVRVTAPVPRLMRIEVGYLVEFTTQSDDTVALAFTITYDDLAVPQSDHWILPVKLTNDFRAISRVLIEEFGSIVVLAGIRLRSMNLRLIVADAAWDPPGGVFDPNVLVQPGTLSNVENGFGFIGSGYRLAITWRPPDAVVLAAGFALPGLPATPHVGSW